MKNKIKSRIAVTLLLNLLLLNSCSKDEKDSGPELQFKANGKTVSLKGANLYLTYSDNCCDNQDYRDYFITDGVYVSGDGWSIDDYTNATYYLGIELAVSGGSDFAPGEFPNYSYLGNAPGESNASYISFESGAQDETFFDCDSPEISVHEPITISGGFDDGEVMTLKFNGILEVYHYDGTNWVYEELQGNFFYKGEVEDVRP